MRKIYTKNSFDGFFTENKKDKTRRLTKRFFSWLGVILSGCGLVVWFYVLYLCAYACM